MIRLGKLKVLHGFRFNQYAAKWHADTYGCCLFGHTHRFQQITPAQAFDSNTGFNCGHLAKDMLSYEENKGPLGHTRGFAFGYFYKNGHFSLYMVRAIGSKLMINGKEYLL